MTNKYSYQVGTGHYHTYFRHIKAWHGQKLKFFGIGHDQIAALYEIDFNQRLAYSFSRHQFTKSSGRIGKPFSNIF
jgi:hypothetical protein